jgi:hypothetical protein
MSEREGVRQPQDHLPPAEERDTDTTTDSPDHPGTPEPDGAGPVSPETAADPRIGEADRHPVDTPPAMS